MIWAVVGAILLLLLLFHLFYLRLYLALWRFRRMDGRVSDQLRPLRGIVALQQESFASLGDSNMYIKKLMVERPDTPAMLTNVGPMPVLILTRPELARRVIEQSNSFQKLRVLKFGDASYFRSIFFAEGQSWKRMREIMSKHFNFNCFKDLVPKISAQARDFMTQLQKPRLDILTDPQLFLGSVMVKLFFDPDTSSESSFETSRIFATFTNAMFVSSRKPINQLAYLLAGEKALAWGLTAEDKQLARYLAEIRQYITGLIDKKKKRFQEGQTSSDFLGLYVEEQFKAVKAGQPPISDQDILQQVASLYFAGIDTTGHLIAFALYALAQYPDVLHQVQEQLAGLGEDITADDLKGLVKLDCVLNQCLRMWPPAIGILMRQAAADVEVEQFSIRKGQLVGVSMLAIMSSPEMFKDPLQFRPWRWLQDGLKDAFAFIPFSGGRRNCIGQHLAKIESKLFVAHVLRRFRLVRTSVPLRPTIYFLYEPSDQDLVRLQPLA